MGLELLLKATKVADTKRVDTLYLRQLDNIDQIVCAKNPLELYTSAVLEQGETVPTLFFTDDYKFNGIRGVNTEQHHIDNVKQWLKNHDGWKIEWLLV